MSPTRHARRIRRLWRIVSVVMPVCAVIVLVAFVVSVRVQQVNDCDARADVRQDTQVQRGGQRVALAVAAERAMADYRRDGRALDRRAARTYRDLIRRTTVPPDLACPVFWHN